MDPFGDEDGDDGDDSYGDPDPIYMGNQRAPKE